jgi:branched-chain amino acid transport system substrate-binding protein
MRAKSSVATLSLLVLGVAACGSTSTPSSTGGAKTLTIAAIIDESGSLGDRGTAAVDGIELAVKEINKAGGFKVGGATYTLALQSQDTAGSPSTATAETVKAVSDDGIKFIFGGIGDETAPMAQTTQSLGAIFFTQTTTAEGIYTAAPSKNPGLYQTTMSGPLFSGYAKEVELLPGKRVAFLMSNIAAGQQFVGALTTALAADGLSVVDTQYWNANQTDFTAALTQIKSKNPDILFLGFDPVAGITQVRQAVQLKVAAGIIGTPFPPSIAVSGATGSPIPIPFVAAFPGRQVQYPASPRVTQFVASFNSLMGTNIDSLGSSSDTVDYYDFVYMLVKAMEQAGSTTDLSAIEKALNSETYSGVLGDSIHFDPTNHTPVYDMDGCLVQSGQIKCESITP